MPTLHCPLLKFPPTPLLRQAQDGEHAEPFSKGGQNNSSALNADATLSVIKIPLNPPEAVKKFSYSKGWGY